MTYKRDGSFYTRITDGKARQDIQYIGWLFPMVQYPTSKDLADHSDLFNIAKLHKTQMTMGHHVCEFCGWEDADYGNGENWIRIDSIVYVAPRMLWHYVKNHNYLLPENFKKAIVARKYKVLSDKEIESLAFGDSDKWIDVPKLKIAAYWKENRFKSMGDLNNQAGWKWHFNEVAIKDGYYKAKLSVVPAYIDVMFEATPNLFPDKIDLEVV